jgi:hypothetical protein
MKTLNFCIFLSFVSVQFLAQGPTEIKVNFFNDRNTDHQVFIRTPNDKLLIGYQSSDMHSSKYTAKHAVSLIDHNAEIDWTLEFPKSKGDIIGLHVSGENGFVFSDFGYELNIHPINLQTGQAGTTKIVDLKKSPENYFSIDGNHLFINQNQFGDNNLTISMLDASFKIVWEETIENSYGVKWQFVQKNDGTIYCSNYKSGEELIIIQVDNKGELKKKALPIKVNSFDLNSILFDNNSNWIMSVNDNKLNFVYKADFVKSDKVGVLIINTDDWSTKNENYDLSAAKAEKNELNGKEDKQTLLLSNSYVHKGEVYASFIRCAVKMENGNNQSTAVAPKKSEDVVIARLSEEMTYHVVNCPIMTLAPWDRVITKKDVDALCFIVNTSKRLGADATKSELHEICLDPKSMKVLSDVVVFENQGELAYSFIFESIKGNTIFLTKKNHTYKGFVRKY